MPKSQPFFAGFFIGRRVVIYGTTWEQESCFAFLNCGFGQVGQILVDFFTAARKHQVDVEPMGDIPRQSLAGETWLQRRRSFERVTMDYRTTPNEGG